MNKLDRLLNLAQSQTGYTEKDNDKDLDTMVGATAGSILMRVTRLTARQ